MIHRRFRATVRVAGVLVWMLAGGGGASASVELGSRYIDPQNGFSLRPPAGGERVREFSRARLVRWVMREKRTRAIAWMLTVRKEPITKPAQGVKGYAKQLWARLEAAPGVRVESVRIADAAGKEAFHVLYQRNDKVVRWQHDLYIRADSARYLVLSIEGPPDGREQLETAFNEVSATFRLIDRVSARQARKANLARGAALLKGLTRQQLDAVAGGEARWYLYRRGGRDIGFCCVSAGAARSGPARGYEVRTFTRLPVAGGKVMHLRRTMFATADRSQERWTEVVRIRQGGKTVRTMEEIGTRQGAVITCRVIADGKSKKLSKPLPPVTAAHYLPRAFALLLGQLVDRKQLAAYTFASYTTAANDFDMRTFTVIGPERIVLGSKTVDAVRAADQVAADAEAAALHLGGDGTLLRMKTDVGVTMERSTRRAVLRRFGDADTLVKGS